MSYELKDYLNSINFTKKDLMKSEDKDWVKKYPAFIINKILSGFQDTIMLVNEVNRNHFLDKDMQYWFLLNSIRSKKRFSPFLRASKLKNIDLVKEYHQCMKSLLMVYTLILNPTLKLTLPYQDRVGQEEQLFMAKQNMKKA